MNYYERHLGDYARDTGHLSILEHGVYNLLMDRYYHTEAGIPETETYRLSRARTEDEKAAVDSVLREFFKLVDGVWIKGRIEDEIEKARLRIGAAKENGKKGGRPAKPKPNPAETQPFNSGSENETGLKAHQAPCSKLHQEQELSSAAKAADPCPHQAIVDLYHELLPQLTRVRSWEADRQTLLRSRWREAPERQSLGWWREFFEYVRSCPFLIGQLSSPGREPFLADLEWLIRPKNFRKVVEGKYEVGKAA